MHVAPLGEGHTELIIWRPHNIRRRDFLTKSVKLNYFIKFSSLLLSIDQSRFYQNFVNFMTPGSWVLVLRHGHSILYSHKLSIYLWWPKSGLPKKCYALRGRGSWAISHLVEILNFFSIVGHTSGKRTVHYMMMG